MKKKIEDIVEEMQSDVVIFVNGKKVFFPITVDDEAGEVTCFSPSVPKMSDEDVSSKKSPSFEQIDIDKVPPVKEDIITLKGEIKIVRV